VSVADILRLASASKRLKKVDEDERKEQINKEAVDNSELDALLDDDDAKSTANASLPIKKHHGKMEDDEADKDEDDDNGESEKGEEEVQDSVQDGKVDSGSSVAADIYAPAAITEEEQYVPNLA
jgi:hypothetical protein